MTLDLLDFDVLDLDPNRLAAVIYRAEDDVDSLLADFAADRLRAGDRLGGIVQRNIKDANGKKLDMQMIDLMTSRAIGICQSLGQGSQACKLDTSGLTEASTAVTRAIAGDVDLIVINKFAKQEANGHGLRSEFVEAILAGRAVLTAVPEKCLDAWSEFTGDRGTTLLCARRVVDAWWHEVSTRAARRAHPLRLAASGPEPLYRS
jgi:nucleoside-triphosphatase THEP1